MQICTLVVRSLLKPETPHHQPGVIVIQLDISNHKPHIRIICPTFLSSHFRPFSPLAELFLEYMDEVGERSVVCQRGCGFGVGMKSDFRPESIEGS